MAPFNDPAKYVYIYVYIYVSFEEIQQYIYIYVSFEVNINVFWAFRTMVLNAQKRP